MTTVISGRAPTNQEAITRALMQQSQPSAPSVQPQVNQQNYFTPADKARREEQKRAWAAYKGKFPNPLKKDDPNKPNLNVRVNRCAPIVDKGVSFLFGQTVTQTVAALHGQTVADSTLKPMQQYLDAAWGDDDDRMTLLTEIATNGAIYGHAFVKVLPPDADGGYEYPTLRNLNPEWITVQTEPDDCKTVASYCIQYDTSDPADSHVTITKRQIIARVDPDTLSDVFGYSDDTPDALAGDTDDRWTITNYERRSATGGPAGALTTTNITTSVVTAVDNSQDQGFVQVGEPEVWPYSWPPIIDCPNLPNPNEFWGMPDLTPDIIHLNEVLNLNQSSINSIAFSHGFPWLWTNSDLRGVEPSPGRVIELKDPEGSLNALMANGDLANLMQFAANTRGDMDEQSRVPSVALGRISELPKGQISGVAIRMLFQPLLEKTTLKQRLYGRLIRAINRCFLILGEMDPSQVRFELGWPNLLPNDDLTAAQTAMAWKQVGVSTDTLLEQNDYDPDIEAERNADAQQRQMRMFSQGKIAPPTPTMIAAMQAQNQANALNQQAGQQQQPSPFLGRGGGGADDGSDGNTGGQ